MQGQVPRGEWSIVVRVERGPLPPPGQCALCPAWPPHAWPCWVLGGALTRCPPVWAGNPKVYTCSSADTGPPPPGARPQDRGCAPYRGLHAELDEGTHPRGIRTRSSGEKGVPCGVGRWVMG